MSDEFIDKTLVAPIKLDDIHGVLEFHPNPDITPLEAAMLAQLWAALILRRTRLDWREYLNTHDLTRHFKEL